MFNSKKNILTLTVSLLVGTSVNAQYASYDFQTGIVSIESGHIDLVGISIEGPDVSLFGCSLCDGDNLPGSDALTNSSTWSVGYNDGATVWARTDPLTGTGFRGTIGDFYIDGNDVPQVWPIDVPPFLDFPDAGEGIATYPVGLSDADFGDVTYMTDSGEVVVVPVCTNLICGNETPVAMDDSYEAVLGNVLSVAAPGVLDNDFDPDDDPIFAALGDIPMLGEVSLNRDGSFSYTAPAIGSVPAGTIDTFSYFVFDDVLASMDTGVVNITLTVPEPQMQVLFFWAVAVFAACWRQLRADRARGA